MQDKTLTTDADMDRDPGLSGANGRAGLPGQGAWKGRLRGLGAVAAIVLLIGLPIRLVVADRAAMVSRDTVNFIWYAQAMAEDPLSAIQQHDQHPLYPALVLGAHRLIEIAPGVPTGLRDDPVRSWTVAAVGVTLLGGLAVIVSVYLLASALFNRQIGLAAALLAAVAAEMCQLSADGLTDMPHLAVYLAAIWAGVRGFQAKRLGWFLAVGLLAGTGYLFRPEGAEPAVVAVVLLCMPYVCQLAWSRRIAAIGCVLAGSALIASPYMLATGKLVQKKSIWRFLEADASAETSELTHELVRVRGVPTGAVGEENESVWHRRLAGAGGRGALPHSEEISLAGSAGDVPRALSSILEKWARSLRGTYLIPVVAWLLWRKRFPGDRAGLRMVQGAVGLHLAILVGLIVQFDYLSLFSLRHVMVLTGLTLPFAAAGIFAIVESLPERRQGWAAMLLGFGLIAPTLPWMFEVRHGDEAHFRSAAVWIRENSPGRPRVLTERHRMAFYAGADYIPGPLTADIAEYLARARQSRPDWLAFDERRILAESPTFFADMEKSLLAGEQLQLARVEMNKLPRGTRRVLVYRYTSSD